MIILLNFPRLWPHLVVFLSLSTKNPIHEDLERWKTSYLKGKKIGAIKAILFLLVFQPEFRNLFYLRCGHIGKLLALCLPPMDTLFLATKDVGPGLFVQHGFATILLAKKVGSNCWINQQVTVGYDAHHGCPTIGNDVTINAGAKIIGGVTIGDRVVIGANAVVVRNVPSDVTVVGVPGRIVRRNGIRVDEKL
ncbi:MAG: serine acetyltransferase [Fibrobacterota bacterium]|nr:serine acetyltransferase [Fibrobacterota bacterium]QQS07707.1 MAG: serine acetyltransferase [Fibrobacterota bacterium]